MPIDFDLDEQLGDLFGESDSPEQPVAQPLSSPVPVRPVPMSHQIPQAKVAGASTTRPNVPVKKLSAVEETLARANYYRIVLSDSIFQDNEDPIGQQVEEEIRKFCQEKLETLLGIRSLVAKSTTGFSFSAMEVDVLKALVKKILGEYQKKKARSSRLASQPAPVAPQLPVETQTTPMVDLPTPALKRRPGRPPGSKNRSKDPTPEGSQVSEPERIQESSQAIEESPQTPSADRGIVRLMTNPVTGATEQYVDPTVSGPVRPDPTGIQPIPMPGRNQMAAIGTQQASRIIDGIANHPAAKSLMAAISLSKQS